MNVDGRETIENLIGWHREKYVTIAPGRPLLLSRNRKGSVVMNRQTAHEILKAAFEAAGLNGKLATHSVLVKEKLGHRNVVTTQKYIGVNYATARETVEAIVLDAKNASSEPYRTDLLSRSFRFLGGELKGTADATLFLELALRGYDLSKLREEPTTDTPEIIKIGNL